MDSLSISSVTEQIRETHLNKKFWPPKKPARQPNPIINRKLRRGLGRIPDKQKQYPTSKELLRTIAYFSAAAYYEPNKLMPYNKAYIVDDEDEDEDEWSTQSDEEKKLEKSIQKTSSHSDKANYKECGISPSSSHVINMKDTCKTLERGGQGILLTKRVSDRGASTCDTFMHFCSREIICPQEHRAALAVKLYGVQAALLSALGNPFENLSQSISPRNSTQISRLSLGQASIGFLPAMIWTGMFIVSFVYTVMVVWSLAFKVPIISMMCLAVLYSLSLLVAAVSGFDVMCGTFRMSGVLFASLGVIGFVMILLVLVMLMLFASWRSTKQNGRAK
ncbi:hypothetical protein Fmac_017684 [Flemingia macrophylla]|uniref:Uncharacterized protein n=1 Tax=Flemingia macrophylla TaxID=520843 RepID=A0ABD1M2W5_9FABA